MELSAATAWWVAAGIAVAVELGTGTFYLLMIALGLAAAAIAAHLGVSAPAQIVAAAIVGGGATALWHWQRRRSRGNELPLRENPDVNLDVGERVSVVAWQPDGTARVHYRGTTWSARLTAGAPPIAGEHLVHAVEGNWLVLAPAARR